MPVYNTLVPNADSVTRTLTRPTEPTTFKPQATLDSLDLALLAAITGPTGPTGSHSGAAVTVSSLLTVTVAAGSVRIDGRRVAVTSGNLTHGTADATNGRIDLVTVDTAGTKAIVAGTAEAVPEAPAVPDGRIVLAAVYVGPGVTTLLSTDIVDKRVWIAMPPWENILWYGADPSGAADSSTAINAAIDALPQSFSGSEGMGGNVFVPVGRFRCNSSIVVHDKEGIRIFGAGAGHQYEGNTGGYGSSLFTGTASMTLIDCTVPSGVVQGGPVIEWINFRDNAGGSTLIALWRVNRWVIDNCFFNGSAAGSGTAIYVSASTTDNAWSEVRNCHWRNLNYGIRTAECYGMTVWGGEMNGVTNGISLEGDATTGEFLSTVRVIGTKFDGGTVGIFTKGTNNFFDHCAFENVPTAIILDGIPSATYSGPINHVVQNMWIASGTSTHKGIQINTNGRECMIGAISGARGNQITFANMILDNSSPNGTKIMGPVSVSSVAAGDYSMFLRNFFDGETIALLQRKSSAFTGRFIAARNESGVEQFAVDTDGRIAFNGLPGAKYLTGSATYDPPSIANGGVGATTTVTVTGAAVGDPVVAVGHTGISAVGWEFYANVTAANTVSVAFVNRTGGTVDLASGTLRVVVAKF